MSNQAQIKELPIPIQAVVDAESKFRSISREKNNGLVWAEQAGYARQIIMANDYLFQTAMSNPQSLKNAIVNLSAIGLSLNPALAYAYLVPRSIKKGKDKKVRYVCLDISYKGLLKLATDTGSIMWGKAKCVYKNDTFKFRGVNKEPIHESDVFGDRGVIVGVYCLAKTHDGDYLVDTMSVDEINKVKDCSMAKNSSAWLEFYDEMAKKSIIKRASKLWPKTDRNQLQDAIHILNEHEGLDQKLIEHEPVKIEQYEVSQEMQDHFNLLFEKQNALEMYVFHETTTLEQWSILYKSFKDEKTKNQGQLRSLVSEGRQQFADCFDYWLEHKQNNDELGMKEIEEELSSDGIELLNRRLKAIK